MPAIKKKWIKASQDGNDLPDDTEDALGDEDRELGDAVNELTVPKAKKRSAPQPQSSMLRGLDGEVLLEKRKRFVPPAELKLSEWLDNNVEKRTDVTLHVPHLYNYYTELCQGDGSDIIDVPEFSRMVRDKFGKTFGLKETSVYKGLLKERKVNEEKKKTGLGIKMKDVVHEAINHFGNPWNGVRFFSLKQFIGTKYPALQIDLRPKILKRALEMGLHWGKIDLVKGIGMAGFYRLPGGEPPPPKPKVKKTGEDLKGEEKGNEGQSSQEEQGEEEKSKEETQNGEDKEKGEDVKKKKTKPKKTEKVSLSKLKHGSPKQIEDTFPLAITYQSAPKASGIPRIRKYIQEKYGETVSDSRWRAAIEKGADKGYWEHVSGSGITGSLHLLMDDFNPGSDQIEDMICAAIIACHEPKAASANQIKKYVSQYHPEFKVDERPDKFKKALLRAVTKNIIVQLSGLGANGSFQLTSNFTPSPNVLAGENDASSDEEDYEIDEPVYIPKGTKSRGMPKVKTMEVISSPKSGKTKDSKKSGSSRGKGRGKQPLSYADSSDEGSVEAPRRKSKKTPSKKKPSKKSPKKRADSPSSDDEIESENEPEYTPRKSQSRGGSATPKSKAATPAKQSLKMAAKSRQEPAKSSPVAAVSSKELGSVTPKKEGEKSKKSKKVVGSRSAEKTTRVRKTGGSAKKPRLDADNDADVESEIEQEYTPRKSKSRGGEEVVASISSTEKKDKKGKMRRSK